MIGKTLSHFRITAKLGEGGMGEVYRAQDTTLDREVAIKVLPAAVAENPERLARFEREAKLLASLDHPNIAGIYEVGHEGGVHFLALQLVGGETLSARIGRGPMPVQEAVGIALQVAEALEVAHGQGIIHRDLKPANVMVDDQGQVKVLDFGLAKAFEAQGAPGGDAALTHSPTLTAQMTSAGVILGTAAYMSPEQAKGEEADKRSDIWSFGVVLTEMLTGRQIFQEPTVSETLASVLKTTPDMEQLPANVPGALRRLLDRCLRKDPHERLHDIADARLVLGDVAAGRLEAEPPAPTRTAPWKTAAMIGIGVALGAVAMLLLSGDRGAPERELPARRFLIEFGDMHDSRPALSPDGQRLAYSKNDQIWVRDLRSLESVAVPGTEGGVVPFWSPDGEWLGFSAQGSLWKIHLDGSARSEVGTPGPDSSAGGAVWTADGRIIFTTGSSDIFEVSDRGGDAKVLVPTEEGEADFHYLSALPGGRGLLTSPHRGDVFDTILHIGLDGTRRELLSLPGRTVGSAVYSPTGHLVFDRSYDLWAAPFSLETLTVTGDPFPIASGASLATIAGDGTLAYSMTLPKVSAEIVVVNREGQIESRIGPPTRGVYPTPALSPDGRTVIAPVAGRTGWDLWSFDVEGSAPRRLTFEDAEMTSNPVWSADGTEVFYSVWRNSEDFKIRVMPSAGGTDGTDLIAATGRVVFSRDGRTMVYSPRSPGFNWDLWMKGVDEEGPGKPLVTGPEWELNPTLSPDGRFLAYDMVGQVLVRSFPGMEGPWQVGTGAVPHWGPQGDRLFYRSGDDMMEVRLTMEPSLRFETPRRLFSLASTPSQLGMTADFAVLPDGERFLMVRPLEPTPGIVLVQNWLGALQ